jgi:hypothetical protein
MSRTAWTFKSRSPSDWSYVFFSKLFVSETEARAEFESSKAHATEHGGAGSLHHGHDVVDRFSVWCPND